MTGKTGTATTVVTDKNTAKTVKSGSLDVFATPMMVALMEEAACNALEKSLEPGQTSVGTEVNIKHIAASPLGANITATAEITQNEGRKITFLLRASEGEKEIGSGTHVRFIVDAEKFMQKIN